MLLATSANAHLGCFPSARLCHEVAADEEVTAYEN